MLPEGMISIEEIPVDLLRAIYHGYKILDWFENLTEKEVPPEWMWSFDDELTEWFEEVKASRDGDSTQQDDRTEVPMMENELTASRRR